MPLLDGAIQFLGFYARHDSRKLNAMSTSAVQRDRGGWERLSASSRPEGRAFIAGRPVAARDGGVFDDVSPIDGKVVCQVARCRAADVDAAVRAAGNSCG